MKLTAEQKIERTHVTLMQHPDFCLFSGMFMIGKVKVLDDPITARTNGRDVDYGREFVDMLDNKMLAFLVIHEAMHKAYRHISTWKKLAKENMRLTNMAADYVINLQIHDMDPDGFVVKFPEDKDGNRIGLIDERFRNMDTKQVYDILKDEQGEEGEEGQSGDGQGEGQNDGGSSSPGKQQKPGSSNQPNDSMDEHDWDGAAELSDEEKERLEQEVDHGLREGAILAGKMKGKVPRGIEEILHPRVDWREALRDFVKATTKGGDITTWRRPNRRFLGADIIMPSMIGQKAECMVIGTDTSGSIGGPILGQFLGEMANICEEIMPERVDILYWDSDVASHETYFGAEVATMVNSTKPRGGGGTDPDCVAKYVMKNKLEPQCVIMLTDGYFYRNEVKVWKNMGVPVFWCVVNNRSFVPLIGQSALVEI
jgi:predicted metal-dependent peptidase